VVGALPQWRLGPERRRWRSRESDKGGEVALKIKQGREDRANVRKNAARDQSGVRLIRLKICQPSPQRRMHKLLNGTTRFVRLVN
jgi:hypothetical protein